jgi:ribosome-binding factor A
MSQRIDRVDELLRQEIGRILAKDVQDPHIGFATVTDVETTPDLRHARVWVSVIGGAPERAETLAALERAMGFVRHELGVRLRIKRIPALHVSLDDSAARGTRVLRIIEELGQGRDSAGEALADMPRAETLPTPVPRRRREGDAEAAGDDATAFDGEVAPAAAGMPVQGGPGQRPGAGPTRRHSSKPRGRRSQTRRADR